MLSANAKLFQQQVDNGCAEAYPTGDVIASERDFAEEFRKRPDVVITALNLLLSEQKVQRVPLRGYRKCRIDPPVDRFQANRKCFNTPNVLEHSLENRETVECISQFAMLLRVCNRQYP